MRMVKASKSTFSLYNQRSHIFKYKLLIEMPQEINESPPEVHRQKPRRVLTATESTILPCGLSSIYNIYGLLWEISVNYTVILLAILPGRLFKNLEVASWISETSAFHLYQKDIVV